MAPKNTTSSPKKAQSQLKQSTLNFKTRKLGTAQPLKAKATLKAAAKAKEKRCDEGESESDVESDTSFVQNFESDDDEDVPVIVKKEELDVNDKAGIYANYSREVRQKLGWIPPIHNEGQAKVHNMLRVFDNTYEYGPCVGLTRLQRWERAEAMGLNPPTEVRDILLTRQGSEDVALVQTVFHGLV